jgi:hypothetical protein
MSIFVETGFTDQTDFIVVRCAVTGNALQSKNRFHFQGNIVKANSTVVYLLKAKSVETEKQPLLARGSETTFISRQRPRNKQQSNIRY